MAVAVTASALVVYVKALAILQQYIGTLEECMP